MNANIVKRTAYQSHLSRAINSLTEKINEEDPDVEEIKIGIEQVQNKFD